MRFSGQMGPGRAGLMALALAISTSGCVHDRGMRVVDAREPAADIGIERFRVAIERIDVDSGRVTVYGSVVVGGGEPVSKVRIEQGERFTAYGFNRRETWTLRSASDVHAIFDVEGSQSGCIAFWPFGPPETRFRDVVIVCGCRRPAVRDP